MSVCVRQCITLGKMLVQMRQYNVPLEISRMQDTYGIWILHSGKMLRYHLLTGLNRDKRFNWNPILDVFLQFTLKVSRILIEKKMIFIS